MASTKENNDFLRQVIPNDLLDSAIEYIKKNFNPDDIFESSTLEEWAEDNGYKKEE